MRNQMQRDFTQGSIPRHLIAFAIPMLASNVLQVMHNVIDSVWVGRFVGPHALGIVSISFPLIFALLSLIIGISMASTTLVAQYRGAGDEPMVRRTVANSLMLLGLFGVTFAVLGVVFRYQLLRLIQTPPEILGEAASYLAIVLGGIPIIFVYYAMEGILRGLGDSKTPLRFMTVSTLTNIVLSPFFILGIGPFPQWGVQGAAVATVVAQLLSSVLIIRYMLAKTDLIRSDRSYWRWDLQVVGLIFKIGLPAGVNMVLVSFSLVAVTTMINRFGADVVSAFGAASKMDQLAILPALSLGTAVGALVGQNLGADKYDRVGAIVKVSCAMVTAITGAVSLVAILSPTVLMRLFTSDVAVLTEGTLYLQIVGASYVLMALSVTLGGLLRGAGDTMWGLIFTFVSLWVLKIPLCWYLSERIGVKGLWLGVAFSTVAGVVLHWGYFAAGLWRKRLVGGERQGAPVAAPADP